jgi:hypothetical protein
MGTPDEVANAAVFLASEDSSYVSGIELCVDGGAAQARPREPRRGLRDSCRNSVNSRQFMRRLAGMWVEKRAAS